MTADILMPETANIVRWRKKLGDAVRQGEVLVEIETDKTVLEVEATDDGIVGAVLAPDGARAIEAERIIGSILSIDEWREKRSLIASDLRPGEEDARPPAQLIASPQEGRGRLPISPLARRLAEEFGLEVSLITGSGPRGRIVKRDILASIERTQRRPTGVTTGAPPAQTEPVMPNPSVDRVKGQIETGQFDVIPVSGMRRAIAERLIESKRLIPHFYLAADVELDALLSLRKQLNEGVPGSTNVSLTKLSLNDFFVRALALALLQVPAANAVWSGDYIRRFRHADVGVAVAIDGGLLTPVIRRAENKTISAISNEIREVVMRARQRRLLPAECQGGATAISNLGMFGVRDFTAIINPPQASILAVGASEQRVVARGAAPVVVNAMTVTLSCDHRVIDGVVGAELLATFKKLVEQPLAMLI